MAIDRETDRQTNRSTDKLSNTIFRKTDLLSGIKRTKSTFNQK